MERKLRLLIDDRLNIRFSWFFDKSSEIGAQLGLSGNRGSASLTPRLNAQLKHFGVVNPLSERSRVPELSRRRTTNPENPS